jgi:hypothetical protein
MLFLQFPCVPLSHEGCRAAFIAAVIPCVAAVERTSACSGFGIAAESYGGLFADKPATEPDQPVPGVVDITLNNAKCA